ncbi:hypothetical protein CAQUA_00910 [Corynebacterium aquatimens]|uniref:Uncharacterized protein n=1 Tax=Corynebacterium aquatimens TaxID=1190508 RepID=A0A931E4Z7_9CORY|nr:hypothetical protein [Corynebacterium aquatimens]WJY64922.1 hypothetical protein CAQUA_00910 [Corynebacterium aquatimens]
MVVAMLAFLAPLCLAMFLVMMEKLEETITTKKVT